MSNDSTPERLAVDGGSPVRTDPWPPRGLFGAEERQAALDLLDGAIASGSVFTYNGEQEIGYCKEFSEFMGGGFADAVNSGTSAVYVALRALDLEPFTEVIVPPITDPGGVMPVPLMNCIPVPADSEPGSYNMGPEQVEARLTEHTSAILVAHIAGIPCDMDPILELARARGIPVVEDCAQTHGATYKGRLAGTLGDIAAFSTMSGKHHASGGQGGIVYTRNEELYWRARRYSDRGKPFGLEPPRTNVAAALNLNMDDLHAAIGRAQLRKLPSIVKRRRQVVQALAQGCRERCAAVRAVEGRPDSESVYWFLFMRLDPDALRVDRDGFVAALSAEGIPAAGSYFCSPVAQEWYRQRRVFGTSGFPWACPLYKGDASAEYDVPNARAADARHFKLALHEGWGEQEVRDTVAALAKVERAYLK